MALALLFLLMCILVAGTVMAAASAAAARAAERGDEQQAYLAVSSAAEFVRGDLATVTEFVATRMETYTGDPLTVTSDTDWSSSSTATAILWDLLLEGAMSITTGGGDYTRELKFSGITGVDDVTLDFTMDSTYNIICTFTTEPADPAAASLYTMSLVSQATTSLQVDTTNIMEDDGITIGTQEVTQTLTVTWGPAEIAKGEAATT
jgi:hypothetical protein